MGFDLTSDTFSNSNLSLVEALPDCATFCNVQCYLLHYIVLSCNTAGVDSNTGVPNSGHPIKNHLNNGHFSVCY